MLVRLTFFILLLSLSSLCAAPSQVEDPYVILEEAKRLAWLNNWYAAKPLFQQAEKLFDDKRDRRNAIFAKIGWLVPQSETMVYSEVADYFTAEAENLIVKNDPELRLWCQAARGYLELEIDVHAAKEAWQDVLSISQSLGKKDWENRANGELGLIAFLEGDSVKAKKLVGAAFWTSRNSGDIGAQIRYASLLGQALIELKEYQKALIPLNEAISQAEKQKDAGLPFMAVCSKSRALMGLGKEREAEQMLEELLGKVRIRNFQGQETFILQLLGKVMQKIDRRDKALEYFQQAAQIAQTGHYYRQLASSMLELAQINLEKGELSQAEEQAKAGAEACRKTGDIYYLPSHLALHAQILTKLGNAAEAKEKYEEALNLIDGMLVGISTPIHKSMLINAMGEIHQEYFAFAAEQEDIESAFNIVERARGRSISDLLQNRPPTSLENGSHPPAQVEIQINRLQKRLRASSSPQEIKAIYKDLKYYEAIQGTQSEPIDNPTTTVPLQLPVSLPSLQKSLGNGEIVLEYLLSDPMSYCLAITSRKVNFVRLPSEKEIDPIIDKFLMAIRNRQTATVEAKGLYSALLSQVIKNRPEHRLIIISDGKLHLLPFAALIDKDGKYVMEQHVISYAPSSTVLHLFRKTSRLKPQPSKVLAVGGIPYGGNWEKASLPSSETIVTRSIEDIKVLKPLPASMEEAAFVANLAGKNGVRLMGKAATETAFVSEPLKEFKVIHLAVHSIADKENPDRAALVFWIDRNSWRDGLLQASEILRLPLKADLVTLSACDTAAGGLKGQEGIANLARAFLMAGGHNVIATLWPAEDNFSLQLMEAFYSNLANGEDLGLALSNAQRKMLNRYGPEALPFYWAGSTITGDGAMKISFPNRQPKR